jgi:hypothetical protein
MFDFVRLLSSFLFTMVCCVSVSHIPYNHDYWPEDDARSKAGYVGIQNLGATCYMASALQFLFFIPDLRESVLEAKVWTYSKP